MRQRAYVGILSTREVWEAQPRVTLASWVFVLKLRERLVKSLKITFKKVVKSILRCRKTISSLKKYWKKWTLQTMVSTRHILHSSAGRWHQQLSPLFPTIGSQIPNLFLKHMVNASSCTVESWIHLGDVLGRLLSSQELEFTKCCRKIWWCVNQPFILFIHHQCRDCSVRTTCFCVVSWR